MRFQSLTIQGWQQFRDISLQFHPRLTILTGANGSGKTTVLRFLARHLGWQLQQLRTPRKDRKSGVFSYIASLFDNDSALDTQGTVEVGAISYSSGRTSAIRIPSIDDQALYQPTIDQPENIQGLFLPSHRPEFSYNKIDNIPTRPKLSTHAFQTVQSALQALQQGGSGRPSSYHMKEALIGLAIFGFGNEKVDANDEARHLFESFERILGIIMPPELGFQSIEVRDSTEIVFITRSGEFLMDAVSGGVGALLLLAWQILMYSSSVDCEYTVVIDEPENHLHASMQRAVLPDLLEAFPEATFVVATHSPLIVGSVRDSNVYALDFDTDHRVDSVELDLANKAGTASEVLREVLGVSVTTPIWVEEELDRMSREFEARPLNKETVQELRARLNELGLGAWIPQAVVDLFCEEDSN